ncbi:hypothetical protein E2C01_037694 [Portunus trituberculatus]|uniref:Uncharacterized protein n=1 Tax=Portunus trituberculatus TaxID=210409 RepID=A0A5B7FEQ3_PORTR|nr:hypothetical protein [Portunus trituberculatus]
MHCDVAGCTMLSHVIFICSDVLRCCAADPRPSNPKESEALRHRLLGPSDPLRCLEINRFLVKGKATQRTGSENRGCERWLWDQPTCSLPTHFPTSHCTTEFKEKENLKRKFSDNTDINRLTRSDSDAVLQ